MINSQIDGEVKRTETPLGPDLPPELCHYRDNGCELADSCLKCPFERCLDEEPGGRKRYLKEQRDSEIVRMYQSEGKAVRELAAAFRVSRRTVERVLKSRRENKYHLSPCGRDKSEGESTTLT